MQNSPIITKMQVIPVAGYDGMLMTLSGAHAPCFTRNLVVLTDNAGHTGVGEIHGGDYTCDCLNAVRPLVEGQPVARYREVLQKIHRIAKHADGDDGEGIQTLDISKLKFVVKSEWAIECAMLDLMGQFLGVPMCTLLGEGQQRKEVEMLGYMFYVSDKNKVPAGEMQYLDESDSPDPWFRLRRQEMLTPERLVEQAEALNEKYGFHNFKLKGGVLRGEEEMEGLRAIKKRFPEARVNIDPNGAWSLDEAIRLCKSMRDVLTYIEDPCGPEAGYSGREIMREFKNAVQMPVATNMIATDWRQFYHTVSLNACDIILADPHFWGFDGAIRMSQLLDSWGLTHYFKAVISGEQFISSKPDPEIFYRAAEMLGTAPEHTLVLEDSYNGVRAGAAGGFVTVMVPDMAPANDEMRRLYTAECASLHEVRRMLEEGRL